MQYQLEHAGVDETEILKACARSGRPLPEKMLNAPELSRGLQIYYRAFFQLNSCRYIGMSAGPIPWTAIVMWCNENEITGRQRRMVFHHVRAMDNAYLNFQAGKMDK